MPWHHRSTHTTGYKVTSTDWNDGVDNDTFQNEIGRQTYTSPVSITATTVGTANQIVSLGAITYENAPIMIEFYCPRYVPGAATANYLILRDGTTVIGTLLHMGTSVTAVPLTLAYPITPTAASHTYNIAGWGSSAGTSTANAGTGGTAGDSTAYLNGYIRATYIPT